MAEARPEDAESNPVPPGFRRDVGLLTLVRFAATGAGFLTSVVGARILGPSSLGAAGVALTVGAIAALVANGGLNIATTYFLGKRPDDRRRIVERSLMLTAVASALAAGLVLLTVALIGGDVLGDPEIGLVVSTAVVAAGIVSFEISGGMLLGLGLRPAYLAQQVIEGVGSFVITAVVLLLIAPTATGMVVSAGVAYVVAAVIATAVAHRTVGAGRPVFDPGYAREALGMGLRGQIGNILNFLNLRLDLLLVPWLVDLGAAGIYLVLLRIAEAVTQVANAASALLFPAVARTEVRQTELTERTVRATLTVVLAAGIAVAVLAPWILTTFFGPAFASGSTALRLTMVAMLPLSVTRLLSGDLKGRGRAGLVSIGAGAALVVTVLLDLLLIPRFGFDGAAMASLVAYTVGAGVLLVAYVAVTGAHVLALVPTPRDATDLLTAGWSLLRGRRAGRSD